MKWSLVNLSHWSKVVAASTDNSNKDGTILRIFNALSLSHCVVIGDSDGVGLSVSIGTSLLSFSIKSAHTESRESILHLL